jgi:hypothetical protein
MIIHHEITSRQKYHTLFLHLSGQGNATCKRKVTYFQKLINSTQHRPGPDTCKVLHAPKAEKSQFCPQGNYIEDKIVTIQVRISRKMQI